MLPSEATERHHPMATGYLVRRGRKVPNRDDDSFLNPIRATQKTGGGG